MEWESLAATESGSPGPFDEAYLQKFAALAGALSAKCVDEARRMAEALAQPGYQKETRRKPAPLRRWAAVFSRDNYTCRYCLRRTIAPPVLRAVSRAFPDVFRYHPNWKTNETDAAYFVLSTSADHVVPVTRGGSDEQSNLVAACWICNSMKSNFLLEELPSWRLHPPAPGEWQGLTDHLDAMIAVASLEQDRYLRSWADAIRSPEPLTR